jgi:hypothetical protein
MRASDHTRFRLQVDISESTVPEDEAVSNLRDEAIRDLPKKRLFDTEASHVSMKLGGRDFLPDASPVTRRLNRTRVSSSTNDLMKDEYDFLIAKRGRFFQEGARLVAPIHLDPEVLDYLSKLALSRRVSLSSLVNTLLKQYRTDRRRPE